MNCHKELAAAIEAARLAGDILRKDLQMGPTGSSPTKAHADVCAEAAIKEVLLGGHERHGYIGEELGAKDGTSGRVWIVDPNDGTKAYLKGERGTAVSIALVDDGELVLGVVNAFAALEGDGQDLFAWAKGGPLTRNNASIRRGPWATAPGGSCRILMSQGARPRDTYEKFVFPCQMITMPSIAYRLALVAAGEAEVAVSTAKPTTWDYAGGHALLLATGGDLYDASGKPVRYGKDGIGPTSNCFGGSPVLAREISERFANMRHFYMYNMEHLQNEVKHLRGDISLAEKKIAEYSVIIKGLGSGDETREEQ
jgi:fructose-1,6-bisphosphatase/inositol monophosphatase family enzyme